MPNTVLGKVTCVPRGDYSASATYTVLDIAGYQGGSYMALKTVTGVTPSNDGINWMQLSGPGLPGEQGEQGEPGAAAGFGQATATVDETTGTPSVDVTTSGPDTAKVFNFAFSGLKGETGAKGDAGDKGDTGATGPQGVSVIDAEINEVGHLVITLSAGEPIDAGSAVGPAGAKGDTGATGPEGASVDHIDRTSGTGAPGTTDTYTVYLTDGSTGGTFNVYNGSNGTGSGDFMADGTVPMSGNLQMNGNKVTNVGAPTEGTDAATKGYTDTALADKQDKVMGSQGKIAGFDAEGNLTPVDPPDTGVTSFNGRSGAVTPSENDYSAGMIKFTDGETFQQKYDAGELTGPQGKQGPKGDTGAPGADGGYYTPAVSDSGDLTWTASKGGMPSVPGVNIKGPKGDTGDAGAPGAKGEKGDTGEQGPAGADGAPGAAATINGVNALTLNATGGLSGSQSGSTYTIDGSGTKPLYIHFTGEDKMNLSADHTVDEAVAAYNAGRDVKAVYEGAIYELRSVAENPQASAEFDIVVANAIKVLFMVGGNTAINMTYDEKLDAYAPLLRTSTLTTAGWSGNSQTVSVLGVSADSDSQLIYVSPADKASATAWGEAGVFCSAQGANSLTFVCDSVPSASINVNISIQEAQT